MRLTKEQKKWIAAALLTALVHILLFCVPWSDLFNLSRHTSPPPIAVQNIDARTMEKIRKHWEGKLLISKNDPSDDQIPPPKDARYISDRNRNVEREQRARDSKVMPEDQPGNEMPNVEHASKSQGAESPQTKPDLSRLGVPMKLDRPQKKTQGQESPDNVALRENRHGGDQSLDEDELPVGAENMLNSRESVFYSYYSRLYQATGPVWESMIRSAMSEVSPPAGEYITSLVVRFDARGQLLGIEVVRESGVPLFDRVAEASWRKIDRFPNPPRELLNAAGQIDLPWGYRVSISKDFNYSITPPRRRY